MELLRLLTHFGILDTFSAFWHISTHFDDLASHPDWRPRFQLDKTHNFRQNGHILANFRHFGQTHRDLIGFFWPKNHWKTTILGFYSSSFGHFCQNPHCFTVSFGSLVPGQQNPENHCFWCFSRFWRKVTKKWVFLGIASGQFLRGPWGLVWVFGQWPLFATFCHPRRPLFGTLKTTENHCFVVYFWPKPMRFLGTSGPISRFWSKKWHFRGFRENGRKSVFFGVKNGSKNDHFWWAIV